MSFLDKILDGDVDEKAVSDMQQCLQSDLFTSQQSSLASTVQSYIPPPPIVTYSTIKPEPATYHPVVLPTTAIKTEPGGSHVPMMTMLQPMQHTTQPGRGPRLTGQPNAGQAILTSQQTAQAILTSGRGQQPIYTSTLATGSISTPSIVPTAVITPQRVHTAIGGLGPQVIAVSSSVMVPMAGGQFAVHTAAPSQAPQTIMVSASPHTTAQMGGIPVAVRPNMISQPIRSLQNKPMVVPIQPLVQVKSQPIPIQPAVRPPQQQQPKSEQKTAAILSSMSTRESVQKLKAFLTNLLNISNKQDAATGQTVKDLIGKVMTNNIDEETFLNELQVALKSPPQPHLLVFLKQSVPVLRNEMQTRQRSMNMGKQPQSAVVSSHTPFPGLAPVQTSKMITGHSMGHQFSGTGSHYHPAPTFSAPQRTFADKYKKKYTLSKDDNEINDVAMMAGVNLNEEAAKISTVDNVSQEQRSTQDVTMFPTESLSSKISRICDMHNVRECSSDVKQLLSHALEARLKNLMEGLVAVNHHRLDLSKQEEQVITTCNVKGQLKILQQIQLEESRRRAEREKAQLMREAKSRSKQSNSEAKAKAKQVAMEEEQLIRQREANETALAAIGSRKRPKQDYLEHMGGGGSNPRFRNHRINMKDVIFLCENDCYLKKSSLLFKLHINPVK